MGPPPLDLGLKRLAKVQILDMKSLSPEMLTLNPRPLWFLKPNHSLVRNYCLFSLFAISFEPLVTRPSPLILTWMETEGNVFRCFKTRKDTILPTFDKWRPAIPSDSYFMPITHLGLAFFFLCELLAPLFAYTRTHLCNLCSRQTASSMT